MVFMFNGQEITAAQGPGEVYSMEERRIGTWIDGKPLYEKTFETTSPTTLSIWQSIYNDESVAEYIEVKGRVFSTVNQGEVFPVPQASANGAVILMLGYDDRGILALTNQTGFLNAKVILTIKYTKTTD